MRKESVLFSLKYTFPSYPTSVGEEAPHRMWDSKTPTV